MQQSWNKFVKSLVALVGGTAVGQLLIVMVTPILTRIYSPHDFAILILFVTFINIACNVVACRYEAAIVVAKHNKDAAYLIFLSLVLSLILSIVATIVCYAFIHFKFFGFGAMPIAAVYWLAPCLFLTMIYTIARFWLIKENDFSLISKVTVMQQVGRATTPIILGFFKLAWVGLIAGELMCRIFGISKLWRRCLDELHTHYRPLRWRRVLIVAKRYRNFPIYFLPSSLLNTLSNSITVPLIAQLFGMMQAGLFALSQRVLILPLSLIGTATADIFYGQAAQLAKASPEEVRQLFFRASKMLALIGIAPAIIIYGWGGQLFSLIFGATWTEAGYYAEILTPWIYTQFVVSPLSRLIFIYDAQRLKLFYDALSFLLTLLIFMLAQDNAWPIVTTLRWISIVNASLYFGFYFVLVKLLYENAEPIAESN